MVDWDKYEIPKISKQQYLLQNILAIRNCNFVCKDKTSTAEFLAQKFELKEKLFQLTFSIAGNNVVAYTSFNELKGWILSIAGISLDAIPSKYFILALLKKTLSPFVDLLAEKYSLSLNLEEIKTVSLDIEKYLFTVRLSRTNSQGKISVVNYFIAGKHSSWIAKSIAKLPIKQNSLEKYAKLQVSFHKSDFPIPYVELISVRPGDIILLNKSGENPNIKIFIENIEFASGKYDSTKVTVDKVAEIRTDQPDDTSSNSIQNIPEDQHEELDEDEEDVDSEIADLKNNETEDSVTEEVADKESAEDDKKEDATIEEAVTDEESEEDDQDEDVATEEAVDKESEEDNKDEDASSESEDVEQKETKDTKTE